VRLNVTADTLLTLLNAVFGLVLTGIGFEMVHNPPDTTTKKVVYRVLFSVFGGAVLVTTFLQSINNSKRQEQDRREAAQAEKVLIEKLGTANGKLDTIAQFQRQFIDFVSAHPGSGGSAESKAYQQMAQAILKLATPISSTNASNPSERHISPAQGIQIKKALSNFSRSRVVIATLSEKTERIEYAEELAKAFKDAGWTVIRHYTDSFSPDPSGVALFLIEQDNTPKPVAQMTALDAAGIPNRILPIRGAVQIGALYGPDADSSVPVIYIGSIQ